MKTLKKLIGQVNLLPKHERFGCSLFFVGVAVFGLFILSQTGWILSNLVVVFLWWIGEPIGIKLLAISLPLMFVGALYFTFTCYND